jgi:aryl-alcohol dehydrogenase-like predicted oxidoreductase
MEPVIVFSMARGTGCRGQRRHHPVFDTAEVYGFGRSERILGEALGEQRGSVFLATKLFPVLPLAPVVEQRAVASASRLGTRLLDLYQVHWPNPVDSDATIMRGMSALQRVGLVGEVGVATTRWRAGRRPRRRWAGGC